MGIHHLISGSYTTTNLWLLTLDTAARTLSLNGTVPGFGLHQYVTANAARDTVYATTMSEPPRLFSWSVSDVLTFEYLDTVNVTTSSCYVSDDGNFAYSAGGPGARINALADDGGLGEQVQEMLYVPKEDIDNVNKTRSAVLYGAHAFDLNVNRKGFVPHLGWDAIFMYDIAENGTAELLSINLSPEAGDGPRNSLPSTDGKRLYAITEHSQYLDVYDVEETQLKHVQRGSVIPDHVRGKYTYRSNTVQYSRDEKYLFASTRSWNNTDSVNGWVAVYELSDCGYFKSPEPIALYEAPLPLGSAAGLRVAFWEDDEKSNGIDDYMYLSDTSEGCMFILGWSAERVALEEVARYCYPDEAAPYEAVWLD